MNALWRKRIVVAAVGLALVAGAAAWSFRGRADVRAIAARYTYWHSALSERRFADAYAVMSTGYRAGHSMEQFAADFEEFGDAFGRLEPGCNVRVHGSHARLYPFEADWLELWNGPDFEWVKTDGEWFLTGEYDWFLD